MPFRVLVVCTGNVCRSPVGERLLTARADERLSAVSAGTRALTGRGIDAPSALALRELGGDPDGHRAQRVTNELTSSADLILTAESEHRSTLVQAEPLLFRRTFTLREFGRLGRELDPLPPDASVAALRERVHEVAAQRGWVEPAGPGGDDVGDPFGADLAVARQCASMIAAAVDDALQVLGISADGATPAASSLR